MKFKVGDEVLISEDSEYYNLNERNPGHCQCVTGVITDINPNTRYNSIIVDWELTDGTNCTNSYNEKDLIFKNPKKLNEVKDNVIYLFEYDYEDFYSFQIKDGFWNCARKSRKYESKNCVKYTKDQFRDKMNNTASWNYSNKFIVIPEGYKFNGEYRTPKNGETYIFTSERFPHGVKRSCQGNAKKEWFILEKENKEEPESFYFQKWNRNIQGDIYKATFNQKREGWEVINTNIKGVSAMPLMSQDTLQDRLDSGCWIKCDPPFHKDEWPEDLFNKNQLSEEDNNMKDITTQEQIFRSNVNGNIKFLCGYIEANITKENALCMLGRTQEDLKNLREGTGSDTLYIKEKIAVLEKEEEALIAILNDKKRS